MTRPGRAYDPFRPPRAPHALDDRFREPALNAKWTLFQTTGLTVLQRRGYLEIASDTHAGNRYQGVMQALPSSGATDFTAWTRAGIQAPFVGTLNYGSGGVLLLQDGTAPNTSDLVAFEMVVTDDTNYGDYVGIQVARYTQFDGSATFLHRRPAFFANAAFLRVRRSGTTLFYEYSVDGLSWVRVFTHTEVFTATHIGLHVNNVNEGETIYGRFGAFGFKASNDAGPIGEW